MNNKFKSFTRTLSDIGPIVFRNVISLTHIVIYTVLTLLFIFHQTQAGIFLAVAIGISVSLGIIQEVRARLALEKLQLLTALRFLRVNSDGSVESVLTELLRKDDRIRLRLGDQIPCDGTLTGTNGIEVNTALLTGESNSFSKSSDEKVLAGGIITSGSAILVVEAPVADSRISQMTKNIKKYSTNFSPIQRSISTAIKYTGYLLIVVIIFVIIRGVIVGQAVVGIVKNIGALANMLVPQGLVLATTILFAYGAVNLLRKRVMLQEINATEKLGRIRNLCMDKTGTLTENILVVETMLVPELSSMEEGKKQTQAYLSGSSDSSETIRALRKFIGGEYLETSPKSVPFSSSRKYGAVLGKSGGDDAAILIGAPDVLLPNFSNSEQKWLNDLMEKHTRDGKRLLCVASMKGTVLPESAIDAKLSLTSVFVFYNQLRPGINNVINFFQDRGTVIRVISGDNSATVHAVSVLAGIKNADAIITGPEMEKWSPEDFYKKTSQYTIFARINPEQKEKIISGFKKSGFTAMVGDGVNDALAIKAADLGIAMFDGSPATRRLAAVVLMDNSFLALPDGVVLAENVIGNIEILASLFFNQVALGFFIFFILSLFGYLFPFTPLNIALTNNFSIGLPTFLIFYWAIRPARELRDGGNKSFLRRVLPFALASAAVQSVALAAVFILSPADFKIGDSNTLVAIAYIILSFMFFVFTPSVYQRGTSRTQKEMLFGFALFEIVALWLLFKIPMLTDFFEITHLPALNRAELSFLLAIFIICAFAQYIVANRFWKFS